MAVHHLNSGRIMPWRRRDGSDGRGGAAGVFTEAQLAALRGLEAEVSRSMRAADHAAATPQRADPLIQLAEALIVVLERERVRRDASGRGPSERRHPVPSGERRVPYADACGRRLDGLLRDVERQLAASRARKELFAEAVDRPSAA